MPITQRTGNRLIRLAFELEQLAGRLREAGMGNEARGLIAASNECRAAGDSVLEAKHPEPLPGQLRKTRRFGLRSFVE